MTILEHEWYKVLKTCWADYEIYPLCTYWYGLCCKPKPKAIQPIALDIVGTESYDVYISMRGTVIYVKEG